MAADMNMHLKCSECGHIPVSINDIIAFPKCKNCGKIFRVLTLPPKTATDEALKPVGEAPIEDCGEYPPIPDSEGAGLSEEEISKRRGELLHELRKYVLPTNYERQGIRSMPSAEERERDAKIAASTTLTEEDRERIQVVKDIWRELALLAQMSNNKAK